VAGGQRLALFGLARCGAHRAVRGVVLVRAGVDSLAVLVAQVGGQGAGAGSVQG
jgi:hypothetical protein